MPVLRVLFRQDSEPDLELDLAGEIGARRIVVAISNQFTRDQEAFSPVASFCKHLVQNRVEAVLDPGVPDKRSDLEAIARLAANHPGISLLLDIPWALESSGTSCFVPERIGMIRFQRPPESARQSGMMHMGSESVSLCVKAMKAWQMNARPGSALVAVLDASWCRGDGARADLTDCRRLTGHWRHVVYNAREAWRLAMTAGEPAA